MLHDQSVPPDQVANTAHDVSGTAVQAGTINGGVHVHPPHRAAALPLRAGIVPPQAALHENLVRWRREA
ncbi:hypothetical protein BBK82_27385 [Lentzea guizhouensis]|uniref:Uncharacterized protein n=1 Tax=Lentzea guizhouensis TaxID=1586287 RepID=A0A1B2HNC9_9PSEU|nr:hypothetical protein [Lentzea guizhouensis]ANZ39233.1 hypothetical protein BBK82_27385 [Lentzea guizhouensis]